MSDAGTTGRPGLLLTDQVVARVALLTGRAFNRNRFNYLRSKYPDSLRPSLVVPPSTNLWAPELVQTVVDLLNARKVVKA